MGLLLISFIAGLLTVLAPCVLPLLPIIVGESVNGETSYKRAIVTILSLGASLFVFTFLLKVSTVLIHVPLEALSILSGVLLILFGILSLFPKVWDHIPFLTKLNIGSNKIMGKGYTKHSFAGDIIVGAALGPVFSSCSPTYFLILATVLPVSLLAGTVYLLVYIVGLCLSLFGIAILGQRLVMRLDGASDPNGWFKRTIGALFIIIGLLVITGYDKKIEASVLAHAGIFDVTRIEQSLLQSRSGEKSAQGPVLQNLTAEQKAAMYSLAPELVKPDGYLNTFGQPISIGQFKGKKVVLIDFWTYSCINCQRTIPYLNQWYAKYKDQGLEIISVHTPEFAFEHDQKNVADALLRFGIKYPVILDNEYQTWNAFGNQFWPREYLIDIDGYIVHDHAGEGEYDVTEKAIQAALQERATRLGTTTDFSSNTVNIADPKLNEVASPETYFGASRNDYLGNGTPGQGGTHTYTFPIMTKRPNTLYLNGSWTLDSEYATSNSVSSGIRFLYSAHDVYLVASAANPVTITVLRDGVPVGSFAGADINPKTSTGTIQGDRLYHLVHETYASAHTIEIKVQGVGLKVYTLTFG